METIRLKLDYLIDSSGWKNEIPVFEDASFRMKTFRLNDYKYSVDIMLQQLFESGINIIHLSVIPLASSCVTLEHPQEMDSCKKGLFSRPAADSGIWIPVHPCVRKYDVNGRIIENLSADDFTKPGNDVTEYSISPDTCLEFTVVQFSVDYDRYYREITDSSEIETLHVTKAKWFKYSCICDIFRYYTRGQFYQVSHTEWPRAWPCQFLAHTFYRHLESISIKTGKQIYPTLCTWIAYSVLISLPDDGRWKHGVWTDVNETHCVFQAKGIQLLIDYYEKSHKEIFKMKAKCALDYLLGIKDSIYDGLPWFLHDTLELSPDMARLFYKNMFDSTAFNKKISNTLCINTHITTLVTLFLYCRIDKIPEYHKLFSDGIKALKMLLSEKPAGFRYWLFYSIRDFLNNYSGNIRLLKKINMKYKNKLQSDILLFLKKKYPRINMPGGYLERDLSNSHLSDSYHLVNLKDLLYLYDIYKADWLYEIITKSTLYTVRHSIAEKNIHDPRANIILEILILLSRCDKRWDEYFKKQLDLINEKSEPLLVDVLSAACRENASGASHLIHKAYRLPCNINRKHQQNP